MRAGRKGVVLLGATGSIGRSALAVLARHPDRFRVVGLSAARNARLLDRLACDTGPDFVVLAGPPPDFTPAWHGDWRYGAEALHEACAAPGADIVVNALVGFAGLSSTLEALAAGRRLALANKESLVAGGELVVTAWREGPGEIVPIDSEHSAIWQCIGDRPAEEVSRLILTASGGPFRETPASRFHEIRPADALAHPTWSMGDKITVDSATLANKALEVIEAHLLFGIPYDRIEVVAHPGSIVHSLVEFRDGSTVAQLGYPTMEVPVLYALSAPERLPNRYRAFDPVEAGPLVFEPLRAPDFPMFGLGLEAGRAGGTLPAAYNAANEVAVRAFLDGRIGFPGIPAVVEAVLARTDAGAIRDVRDVREADARARDLAGEEIARVA
ncbi:MAG: 1-deoxy-D-xylulose-5-phosphate reductoisomerase [Gemmatimonadota bacterium]|nr:1-deoxy-D-xylulose-5-phosphate reductoisomerase [Gemmatimonadota bacterium]